MSAQLIGEVREAERAVGRADLGLPPLRIVADAVVALDSPEESAAARLTRLDAAAIRKSSIRSDARVLAGPARHLASAISSWRDAGVDGVRLRPLVQPRDLRAIAETLLPELRGRGLARDADAVPATLRERFGLAAAGNRYARPETGPVSEPQLEGAAA